MAQSEQIAQLNEWIKSTDNIVFFGGAGVSTESGIPDFRSKDGLYSEKYDYPPEKILSHSFFYSNTKYFYKFYIIIFLKIFTYRSIWNYNNYHDSYTNKS